MKVTLANIAPAPGAPNAPSLTPEMLAAVAARYSRNGEGLETILSTVAGMDPDRAVDSIFNMVDYGHASIADMTPIPIFMDGISIWLAWKLWEMLPRAVGQETSTRYVRYDRDGVLSPGETGLSPRFWDCYKRGIEKAFAHYHDALDTWMAIAEQQPQLVRLPPGTTPKAAARIRRNFAFDRARYWLPAAAKTNVFMLMNALDWAKAVRTLLSIPLPETQTAGKAILEALGQAAPRMVRHARATDDSIAGFRSEVHALANLITSAPAPTSTARPAIEFRLTPPMPGWDSMPAVSALSHHPNRYSWVGPHLKRWHADFRIHGVAFAEIRDLNRHRTGYKCQPRIPLGFYGAQDQAGQAGAEIGKAMAFGIAQAIEEAEAVSRSEAAAPYLGLLGTTYLFEHGTSLDHLIYEIELRTGAGSHWRYADHYHAVHGALIQAMPELENHIHLGTAEPE